MRPLFLAIPLALIVAACDSDDSPPVSYCSAATDCPTGSVCEFLVSDGCSAQGECAVLSTTSCATQPVCSCAGSTENVCVLGGYASNGAVRALGACGGDEDAGPLDSGVDVPGDAASDSPNE